jgi:hypothetical protein
MCASELCIELVCDRDATLRRATNYLLFNFIKGSPYINLFQVFAVVVVQIIFNPPLCSKDFPIILEECTASILRVNGPDSVTLKMEAVPSSEISEQIFTSLREKMANVQSFLS